MNSSQPAPRILPPFRLAWLLLAWFLLAGCQPEATAEAKPVSPPPTRASSTLLVPADQPGDLVSPSPTRALSTSSTAAPLPAPAGTPTVAPPATRTPRLTASPIPTLPAGYVTVPPGQVTVPILLYHNVSDQGSTPYILRPAEFRAQMKALYEAGYQTVTVSELAAVIREGGLLPEKAVAITFDDGYEGVYEHAYPVMEEYGFRATVYVIAQTLEKEKSYGYLKKAELLELHRSGWEIGSHSISHSNLKTTPLGLGNELVGSKQQLEEQLGVEVRSFSYPYNVANGWIRKRAEVYGYESAVGVDLYITHTTERLYFLSRREVQRGMRIKAFMALLTPGAYEIAAGTPEPTRATP